MSPTIRQAGPADLEPVQIIIKEFYDLFGYPYEQERHRRMLTEFLATPALGSIWMVYHETALAGYLALTNGYSFEFGGHYALVDEFFIREAYRSLGLGRAVLTEIQQKARQSGLQALHLQTESYNPRAKPLYESLGFRDLNRSILSWEVTE